MHRAVFTAPAPGTAPILHRGSGVWWHSVLAPGPPVSFNRYTIGGFSAGVPQPPCNPVRPGRNEGQTRVLANHRTWRVASIVMAAYACCAGVTAMACIADPALEGSLEDWRTIWRLDLADRVVASAAFGAFVIVCVLCATLAAPAWFLWRTKVREVPTSAKWVLGYVAGVSAAVVLLFSLVVTAERQENFFYNGGTVVVGEGQIEAVAIQSLFVVIPVLVFAAVWFGTSGQTAGKRGNPS